MKPPVALPKKKSTKFYLLLKAKNQASLSTQLHAVCIKIKRRKEKC